MNRKIFTHIIANIVILTAMSISSSSAEAQNPLLQPWNTPYQTPPFSQIDNSHYTPAIRQAINEADRNIDAIAKQQAAPTFDNTIVALEQSQELLERVSAILFNLNECNTNPEMQQIVMKLTPELTRFNNKVMMNEQLFARVKSLYERRHELTLTTEQLTVLEDWYNAFVRGGVGLDKKDKKVFSANAEELSELSEQFNQNVLADNNAYTLHITDAADLGGLPEGIIAAAREEAQQRHLDGWVFTLDAPSYRPFLQYADNRSLREQMWRAYNSRGNHGDAHDNNVIIQRITRLRYEQARLLGYDYYAAYRLANTMALTPQTVNDFISKLLNAAYPVAQNDVKEVSDYAATLGATLPLQSWDFSYYSEKLKRDRYSFDAEVLRPYFQLERVRQGIFNLYGTLYGLTFVENSAIEVYHPDVKVYEVHDAENRFMGVLYLDMFPRPSKRGGAWMTEFRGQSNIGGHQVRPLIQVVCNFSKPVGDKPALLSFDEVETFMHEFGHAMHGMLSDVTYPSVSGTNVKHDFVEMPSQVMENWCYESAFLNSFAKHYLSGDTISADYIARLRRSKNYLAGYLCVRQLNFGIIDIAFHSLTPDSNGHWPLDGDVSDFERNHTVAVLPAIPGTGISTAFTHIFSGGYAAGYYGYKWAETLDADIFSRFKQDGIFNATTAQAFRREILSRGGSEHPSVLFRNFMGRNPNTDALLLRDGFLQPVQRK